MILVINVLAVSSIEIECQFSLSRWDNFVNNPYRCWVLSVSRADETVITRINGNHLVGRTNFDVNDFDWRYNPVGYVPSNIDAFFPNIKSVQFFKTQLTSISANDLNQFPNLKSLYVHHNNLTILEGDLFDGTPNLRFINFDYNPFQNISQNLIDGLDQLKEAWFFIAGCLNFYAQTPAQLEELRIMFVTNCPFNPPTTTEIIPTTTENQCSNACVDLIDENVVKLSIEVTELRDGIAQVRLENEKLREDSAAREEVANERFAELERQLRELHSLPCSQ